MNTINRATIDLIKSFEGLRLTSYRCPANILTVGYGHTGSDVKEGMTITEREAETLLLRDVSRFAKNVDKLTSTVKLNDNEFGALVSFDFNTGGLASSTALKKLLRGNKKGCVEAMSWWCKAKVNGVMRELPGLVRRRKAEEELFMREVGNESAIAG